MLVIGKSMTSKIVSEQKRVWEIGETLYIANVFCVSLDINEKKKTIQCKTRMRRRKKPHVCHAIK